MRDICHAITCAPEAPTEVVHNESLSVGKTEKNYCVYDIEKSLANVFHGCEVTFGAFNDYYRSHRVCFDKVVTSLPEFKCGCDVMTGTQELHEVFERIGMSRDIFEFRTFTRPKQIEHLLRTQQIDAQFFWV